VRDLPYGPRAVLLELPDADAVAQLAAAALDRLPPGVEELVPAALTVLVRFDPSRTGAASAAAGVRALAADYGASRHAEAAAEPVVVPVVYDGPDLADVAKLVGCSVEEVVARHSGALYRCAFCGFAPGFSYLVGGDARLNVPRLAEPRPQVPAGAVAIAAGFSAVYPTASPGGWRLLGRTDVAMWDLDRSPPALAPPGAQVRFTRVRASASGGRP
jgi:KipI family sensor histidine kinase inhibitor